MLKCWGERPVRPNQLKKKLKAITVSDNIYNLTSLTEK